MMGILDEIKKCVAERRLLWTYHVMMRMDDRFIPRQVILDAVESYELIEEYPDDKYMPSCLVRGESGELTFHVVCAVDSDKGVVRIVTAYRPSPDKWDKEGRSRKL